MHTANVLANLLQSLNWFARSIQNHVGRIEVDEQVVAFDIVNEMQQVVGRFLPGFQVHPLPVAANVIQDISRDGNQILVVV